MGVDAAVLVLVFVFVFVLFARDVGDPDGDRDFGLMMTPPASFASFEFTRLTRGCRRGCGCG